MHHLTRCDCNGSQHRRRLLDEYSDKLSSFGPLLRRDIHFCVYDPVSTSPDSLDDTTEITRLHLRVFIRLATV